MRKIYRKWTPEEIQFLKDNYPQRGSIFCAETLKREKYLIRLKAKSLGIEAKFLFWDDDQIKFLKENYPTKGVKYCAEQLGKKECSVKNKVFALSLASLPLWTDEEVSFLKENYPKHGSLYCSKHLKFSRDQIVSKASLLGIRYLKPYQLISAPDGHMVCVSCLAVKLMEDFSTDTRLKNGKKNKCKTCDSQKSCKYAKNNSEKVSKQQKKWMTKNREYIRQYRKNRRHIDRQLAKKRYHSNEKAKQKIIDASKAYRKNPDNKHRIKETRKKLIKIYRQNPYWRLKSNLRRRLCFVIRGERKADITEKLVGCSWEQLRSHLESQFISGMTWENYGKVWHVDHILPCESFDLSLPEEQFKCFHYSNLRPLWATTEIAQYFGDFVNIGNSNKQHKILQNMGLSRD